MKLRKLFRKERRKRVYISGKMRGLDRAEVLFRFSRCELWLRHNGFAVKNPCHTWVFRWPWLYKTMEKLFGEERTYDLVLLYDLWLVSRCDRIHMIGSDWKESRGARTERYFAQAKGLEVTTDYIPKDRK